MTRHPLLRSTWMALLAGFALGGAALAASGSPSSDFAAAEAAAFAEADASGSGKLTPEEFANYNVLLRQKLHAGTGDREACERLVERHLGRIVTFAHRTLGNRSDAEDAAQDVFLRVWSAAPRWKRGSARFSTWPYRVAMNVCLDRIAKKRETTADDLPELADPRPEPSLALHGSEVASHVSAALATLPETQRIAVTLCHYQGLRNTEAAEIISVSVEALEALLARGRRALPGRIGAIDTSMPREG